MKWIAVLFLMLPVRWAGAAECHDLFIPRSSAPTVEIQRPALYSVSKDGHTSFIFGTFNHALTIDVLPRFVFKAITQNQFFVSDFNADQSAPTGIFESASNAKLGDTVSPATWSKVREQFPWASDRIHPALPYLQFLEGLQRDVGGAAGDSQNSMEAQLRNLARRKGRFITFLEDVTEVIGAYIGAVSPQLLDWTLAETNTELILESNRRSLEAQRAAYLAGDISGFQRLYEDSFETLRNTSVLRAVVKDRNERWIKKLLELHNKGGFFFAVELGHLGGESGLIELLDANDFVIRRVRSPADFKPRRDGDGRIKPKSNSAQPKSNSKKPLH